MSKHARKIDKPVAWFPVDSRIMFPFFAPTHVHGAARVFLGLEIVLSLLIVSGSLALVILHLL